MGHISGDDIQPGLLVAAGVVDGQGRVLIPEGAVLTEAHVRALKMRGIRSICVQDEEEEANTQPEDLVSPELLRKIQLHAEKMLRFNRDHFTHPFVRSAALVFVRRRCQTGQRAFQEEVTITQSDFASASESDAEDTSPPLPIEKVIDQVQSIASLPSVYNELVSKINHPNSSAADVAEVISSDPGLTVRLLRIVNSAFYSFPSKIETVSRAITIIGMRELTEMALATSVIQMFQGPLEGIVDMERFWRHSITCGAINRQMASNRREINCERFFVVGLLHDIGRLVMLSQAPEHVRRAYDLAKSRNIPLLLAETQAWGYSHADLGRMLLETWKLPPSQSEAVGNHHRPQDANRFTVEAQSLHVADFIANILAMGLAGVDHFPVVRPEAWDQLELTPDLVGIMADEARKQVDELISVFM